MEQIIITDISHWEDDPYTAKKIDFNKMKSAGAVGVIFKASQGTWMDSVFKSSWADAKTAGLLRGMYHFLDWSTTGVKQAEYYCKLYDIDPPDFPPIVDFEYKVGIENVSPNGELWNWLQYTKTHTNRIPMIYTAPYFWQDYGTTNPSWTNFYLWIANYEVTSPKVPAPWKIWTMWQYTDHGDGIKYGCEAKEVDLNYWNGDLESLYEFCGQGTPPDDTPTRDECIDDMLIKHGYTWKE